MQPGRARTSGLGVPLLPLARWVGWVAPVRPTHGYWFFPVPRPPYVCAVSWAAGLLFTGVPGRFAVLRLRCPGPACSCSPVCSLGVLCCMCGVLGHLAPVHRCACCVRCACAMGGCVSLPPPLIFVFFLFFFFGKKKRKTGARVYCVSAASPICSDFQTFCPDWLHFGHFLCFGGIAASQLSLRIFPIYF